MGNMFAQYAALVQYSIVFLLAGAVVFFVVDAIAKKVCQ